MVNLPDRHPNRLLKRRPRLLIMLFGAVWLYSLIQLLGALDFAAAIRDGANAPVSVSISVPVLIYGFWCACFTGTLMLLVWQPARVMRWLVRLWAGWALTQLLLIILFARAEYDRGRWPFVALVLIGVGVVVWGLVRRDIRRDLRSTG